MRLVTLAFAFVYLCHPSLARDSGQWDDLATPENVKQWYRTLMQPDIPAISCCGESDAYWADSFEQSPNGEWVAIITDTRDDAMLRRPHIDVGTKIVIPNYKLKHDQGNPTGHGVVFISIRSGVNGGVDYHVYCYVTPGLL